jgi:hypothetical protein
MAPASRVGRRRPEPPPDGHFGQSGSGQATRVHGNESGQSPPLTGYPLLCAGPQPPPTFTEIMRHVGGGLLKAAFAKGFR